MQSVTRNFRTLSLGLFETIFYKVGEKKLHTIWHVVKVKQHFLQVVAVTTDWDRILLQSVKYITKCGNYYKMGRSTFICR